MINTIFHETTDSADHSKNEQTAINRGDTAEDIWGLKNYNNTNTNNMSGADWYASNQYSNAIIDGTRDYAYNQINDWLGNGDMNYQTVPGAINIINDWTGVNRLDPIYQAMIPEQYNLDSAFGDVGIRKDTTNFVSMVIAGATTWALGPEMGALFYAESQAIGKEWQNSGWDDVYDTSVQLYIKQSQIFPPDMALMPMPKLYQVSNGIGNMVLDGINFYGPSKISSITGPKIRDYLIGKGASREAAIGAEIINDWGTGELWNSGTKRFKDGE